MSRPFSAGFAQVLFGLGYKGRPEGATQFPASCDLTPTRVHAGESVRHWFSRCVNDVLDGALERCVVEDNLALFIGLGWRSGTQLTYLRCQCLAVQGADLESYYLGADCEESYLRLDFDATQLGPIFTHPLPHVHAQPHGGIRFPLDAPHSANVLIDFIDFVYRNFCHDVWIDWARNVWEEEVRRRAIEDDPFEPIVEAFQANQVNDLLTTYREHLNWMKAAWRREKDEMFPLRVADDYRALLSYTS